MIIDLLAKKQTTEENYRKTVLAGEKTYRKTFDPKFRHKAIVIARCAYYRKVAADHRCIWMPGTDRLD